MDYKHECMKLRVQAERNRSQAAKLRPDDPYRLLFLETADRLEAAAVETEARHG